MQTPLVFLFPGQGSQRTGMGKDVFEHYPAIRQNYFEAADDILGFRLSKLCFEGPDQALAETENTQPALLVTSLALLAVLQEEGIAPSVVAGHSLGEYSALVAAGVLDFADALRVVRKRGELMSKIGQATKGSMSAIIGLSSEMIEDYCYLAAPYGLVSIANYNDPFQNVISGEVAALEFVEDLARQAGARSVIRLKVSAPFHCSLMASLSQEFAQELAKYKFRPPRISIISNVKADFLTGAIEVQEALQLQVQAPVRWTTIMSRLLADGHQTFLEVGPGKVLSGLGRQHSEEARFHNIDSLKRLADFKLKYNSAQELVVAN